jgi:hypothetical protein
MPLVGAAPARLTLIDGDVVIPIRDVPMKSEDPLRWQLPAVLCREWDPGAPEPRTAVFERAGLDGVDDATAFTGPRTVTLDLVVFGGGDIGIGYQTVERSAYYLVEQLVTMTHPSRRPYLYVRRPATPGEDMALVADDAGWRLKLRGNPFSITYGRKAATMLELSLVFTAPEGLFESDWRQDYSAQAGEGTATFTFGDTDANIFTLGTQDAAQFTFGTAADKSPTFTVNVDSAIPVPPVLYFYGPAVDPRVDLSTGQSFGFTGLSIESGQYVQVDMAAGTALLGGSWDAPVYHLVDWTHSTFWRLSGPVQATFTGGAAGGRLVIQWRDRRLTV